MFKCLKSPDLIPNIFTHKILKLPANKSLQRLSLKRNELGKKKNKQISKWKTLWFWT